MIILKLMSYKFRGKNKILEKFTPMDTHQIHKFPNVCTKEKLFCTYMYVHLCTLMYIEYTYIGIYNKRIPLQHKRNYY